ncbi:MAG: MarR family transcriptional regulator [Solirubrobacterales bacterium]
MTLIQTPSEAARFSSEVSAEVRETALRVGSLFRHLVSYNDGGTSLRAIDRHGLTFVQFKVLMELYSAGPEAPYIQELSKTLGASTPSLSRAVEGLFKKELVFRIEDPDDRRRRRISLTAEGREVMDQFYLSRAAGLFEFVAGLADEQRLALDSAIGDLLDREEIAAIYEQLEGMVPG